MKIVIKQTPTTTIPKQTEVKLVVSYVEFSVKPKPFGVVLQKLNQKSVVKSNKTYGVVLNKQINNKTLKQND